MPSYRVTPGSARWLSGRIASAKGGRRELQMEVDVQITLDDGTVLGPEPRAIQVPDIRDDPEALREAILRAIERTVRDEQRHRNRRPAEAPAVPNLPAGERTLGDP